MPAKRVFRPPTEERLIKSALHYLDRYPTTEANLRRVLERKVVNACNHLELEPSDYFDLISAVVEKCIKSELFDDVRYAEAKTSSLRRKGQSGRKIQAHLAAKGVDRDIITKVLTNEETDETAAAHSFARRRRLGPFADPAKRADNRDKHLAAMCRAGFSYSLAVSVIDASDDAEP